MNLVLARWNAADPTSAMNAMMNCCGAHRWAEAMAKHRPILTETDLHEAANRFWNMMTEQDWMEAFAHHPRIGERKASAASRQSSVWSAQEQSSTQTAADAVRAALAEGNACYEETFGFTYIVCATGKSTEEMLRILQNRLTNTHEAELREAAEQQRQIMHIRLTKWLEQ